MTKILVIGNGGREHTLAWKLAQSAHVDQIYIAPGNGGTEWAARPGFASASNVPIAADDTPALITFARQNAIDLAVVGPEAPLAAGIVDAFQDAQIKIFGPVQGAAQLEASKAFAKDFMTEQGIPTAEYAIFDEELPARAYLSEFNKPVVIKADGLAAGKGVIVCDTREEAGQAIHAMLVNKAFGAASDTIIIEERLAGREISVLAFCDGRTVKPMLVARDYKRAYDNDEGPNTGGMGAIAPAPDFTPEQVAEVTRTILQPILTGMENLGTPFVGVLYAGLMLTSEGIKTLEYNCRFGDPETQVVLPLLKTDLYEVLLACVEGRLDQINLEWHEAACAAVVIATGDYPQSSEKGLPITGLHDTPEDILVFHAGTIVQNNELVTNGGRVLAIGAVGATLDEALARAYEGVDRVWFDNMHYRSDIGATPA